MRAIVTVVFLIAGTIILAGIASGEDKPWFDMQNCELCKVYMEDPMLMPNMQWEEYETNNGIVSITTVNEKFLPSLRTSHAKMMKNIERLEQGDTLYICGMCTEMGRLMELGAKFEYFETERGYMSLFTAEDPKLIAAIKAMSARGKEEWKKMEMMQKGQEPGHEGHDND